MPAQSATYAFKDTSGIITNPILLVPIVFAGFIGMGKFSIDMHTERTVLDTAADGTVMPSYIAGDSADFTVEAQQTSRLHQQFLDLYNALKIAADAGDVSNWAATSISLRNITYASQHILTGVAFTKIPGQAYEQQGNRITWRLVACNAIRT